MEEYLNFIDKTYTEEHLIERVKYYVLQAQQVDELLADSKVADALKLARPIKTELKKEYKIYTRTKDFKSIQLDKNASVYSSWVSDAALKTSGNISSENVTQFTYDIQDYAKHYYPDFF